MSGLAGSVLTGMGSVPTAAGDDGTSVTGAVTQLLAGTGINLVPPTGVGAVTVSATGAAFPGYGATATRVVSTSTAGAALTASRSDHAHGLDLVAYAPTVAGMQAAGVVQQAYAAPTATPSVLTMVAGQVPFGASTGLLTQSSGLTYTDAPAAGRGITITMSGFASADDLHPIRINATTAGTARAWIDYQYNGVTAWDTGLFATAAGALIYRVMFRDDLNPAPAGAVTFAVSRAATSPSGGGSGSPFTVDMLTGSVGVGATSALPAGSTGGFLWLPRVAATPTVLPTKGPLGSRDPWASDAGNRRLWGTFGDINAWHWASLYDYDAFPARIPFGSATLLSLTDDAAFLYTEATNTLTVDSVASNTNTTLSLKATGIAFLQLSSNGTVWQTLGPSGINTFAGSNTAAPGGIYGDMVWSASNSRLTFGAPGGSPAVGSIYLNSSTDSNIPYSTTYVTLYIDDAGGGGQASIYVTNNLYAKNLIGQQSEDIAVSVRPGNVLHLAYASDIIGAATDAITVDGTTGAIALLEDVTHTGGTFDVTAATSAAMGAGGARLLINTDMLFKYTGSGGGDAMRIDDADGQITTNTAITMNALLQLGAPLIQAAGAVTVNMTNAPAGVAATPKEYMIVKGTGGATRYIALLGA